MRRSDTIGQIADALAKAQADIKAAVKDANNPHFKTAYADLASVRAACTAQLSKNGIAVAQSPEADGPKVTVTTLLAHSSGEWLEGSLTLQARDASPQAVGSAITYGRRYGLASMVGVAPDDDDGEAAQPAKRQPRRDAAPVEERPRQEPPPMQEAPRAAAAHGDTRLITDGQRRRFFTIATNKEWTKDDVRKLLARFGYESSKDITVKDYDALVKVLETGELVEDREPGGDDLDFPAPWEEGSAH